MKSKQTGNTHHLLGIIWPFIMVTLLIAILGGISLQIQSAMRAYISGESLWSKGQKDAIYYLSLYADTRDPRHFREYENAIAIPLGDRRARLALDNPQPDLLQAEAGFLQGNNHPEDIKGVIWLFQHFRYFSYMEQAIAHWEFGDRNVLALELLAQEIRQKVNSGQTGPETVARWKARIYAINNRVTPIEKAFSDTLGEGARYIQRLLLAANLGTATLLIMLIVLRTRKLMTQRESFERALHTEKERAQITLASIGDAVITTDVEGLIAYMNPAAEKLTTWSAQQAYGLPLPSLFRLIDEETNQEGLTLIHHILAGKNTGSGNTQLLVRLDGSAVAVALVGAPIHADGRISGAVLVLHDMTRERQYIASLSWQASHDALTGLANRREFEFRLEQALSGSHHAQAPQHALMFLDMDQFKVVNDTCGHAAGDELLRQICLLLQQRLRDGDTLARLGGDEFGILLEHCPASTAAQIAETLRQTVQDLHFIWGGRTFNVSVSIGLVHINTALTTLAEALRAADVACYMAKEKGRNRVQLYHPDDSELSMRFGEMAWVQRLHLALEEKRLCLYAQEIVPLPHNDAPTGGVHVELLLRLHDEVGRLVPPISFIPAAERYGLMPLIDRWVVENAFSSLAARLRYNQSSPIDVCAINLSGSTIGDEAFLDFLRDKFTQYAIPPGMICFEITETSAIANLTSAIRFITELKTLGCRFSLDDFGAGMSSFSYLKHLPVDYLKIDGSFVKDMLDDEIDHAMVEVINHIGHVMGKRTIAEFVETPGIIQALSAIGVDYAQGYAVSKPKPFDYQMHYPSETPPSADSDTPLPDAPRKGTHL